VPHRAGHVTQTLLSVPHKAGHVAQTLLSVLCEGSHDDVMLDLRAGRPRSQAAHAVTFCHTVSPDSSESASATTPIASGSPYSSSIFSLFGAVRRVFSR